jgi:TonB family protein
MMPGEPEEDNSDYRNYSLFSADDENVYGVFRLRLTPHDAQLRPEIFYKSLIGNFAKKAGIEIEGETGVVLDGHEGREYKMKRNREREVRRLFRIGNSLYTIVATSIRLELNATSASRFFDSFKPIEKSPEDAFDLGQQPANSPFAEFDNQLKRQGGWGDYEKQKRLAELFNIGRKRLGDRFEPELMKYIGQDLERHIWIPLFLKDPDFLQGAPPLPQLSLRIQHQGIALLERKEDMDSLMSVVTLSVRSAVLSAQLGQRKQAMSHKTRVERLLLKDSTFAFGFPPMYEKEADLYESLPFHNEAGAGKSQMIWRANEANHYRFSRDPEPKKVAVAPEALQERAIKKAPPVYPLEGRASGVAGLVKVQVLISVEGNVIETIAEGPEQFREAAIEAARQWTFKPMIIEGKAARMSGLLSFTFTLK